MRRKRGWIGGLSLLAVLGLTNCLPEERVWWSPRGDRALVRLDDHLHVVNAQGELGAALGEDLSMEQVLVKTVSWLPDSSGWVAERTRRSTRWAEVRTQIPAEEAAEVEALVPVVPALLEAVARVTGTSGRLEAAMAVLPELKTTRFLSALRCAIEQDPIRLEALVRALPQGAQVWDDLHQKDAAHEVHELYSVRLDGDRPRAPQRLSAHLLHPRIRPRVSPQHPAYACVRFDEQAETATLEVRSLAGGPVLTVANGVSTAFEWSPDGRSLIFLAPLGGEGDKLQGLHRVTVLDERGALLPPPAASGGAATARLGEAQTLATVLVPGTPALQVLPDGRVLLACQPLTLPATGTGPVPEPRLFVVATDGSAVVPVPTAPGALPTHLGYFVASPDGQRVAVVESETDAVAVVEVATGKTDLLSPAHPGWQGRTLPAWKSATELTYVALDAGGVPRWQLWSPAMTAPRSLSALWPVKALSDWLKAPEAAAPDRKPKEAP